MATTPREVGAGGHFTTFTRAQWKAMGRPAGHDLSAADIAMLAATGDPVSLDEVGEIYLPLAQLLAVYAEARAHLRRNVDAFLGHRGRDAPFVIGVAGSVAVGKSTTARILQSLLSRGPHHPSVALVTTDGFLYPNATLEARGILDRKGFPESYDRRRLIEDLAAIRAGETVEIPVYSHLAYDIVPGAFQRVERPDMVIVEGLNVLQVDGRDAPSASVVVSDFFDFSIYVDAAERDIARWFTERLLELQATVLHRPTSYFHALSAMSTGEVSSIAARIWDEVNLVNLRLNIAPTAARAHLILEKGGDHRVLRARLREA